MAQASVSDPEEDPGHAGVTMSPSWPGNALGSSRKSWRKCPGRGKSGCPCSDSCPCDPAPDKQTKMDGWMDGSKMKGLHLYFCSVPDSRYRCVVQEVYSLFLTDFSDSPQRHSDCRASLQISGCCH